MDEQGKVADNTVPRCKRIVSLQFQGFLWLFLPTIHAQVDPETNTSEFYYPSNPLKEMYKISV